MNTYLLVLCTCPEGESAAQLAESLIEARLAACVNVLPEVHSVYRWEGKIVHDAERLLLIKTETAAFPALKDHILVRHPYATPEVIALPISDASPAYLDWIHACLSSDS
ncbi:MAG TPA: divalent-cation tolerance protein CutA [Methylococcaceae bacterium]|nr:divalent-cation tolerance protein CutA [Methylococcaceae bacterium]